MGGNAPPPTTYSTTLSPASSSEPSGNNGQDGLSDHIITAIGVDKRTPEIGADLSTRTLEYSASQAHGPLFASFGSEVCHATICTITFEGPVKGVIFLSTPQEATEDCRAPCDLTARRWSCMSPVADYLSCCIHLQSVGPPVGAFPVAVRTLSTAPRK
jgi:hypothetical protein